MELIIETVVWILSGIVFSGFSLWFLLDSAKDLRLLRSGEAKPIRELLVRREMRMAFFLCFVAFLGIAITIEALIPSMLLESRQILGRSMFLVMELSLTAMVYLLVKDKRDARRLAEEEEMRNLENKNDRS